MSRVEILLRNHRWVILIGTLALLAVNASAQGSVPVPQVTTTGAVEGEFVKWALTQGGLTVVVLVLFWSYRRDTARIISEAHDRNETLRSIMQEAITAMSTHAEAARSQAANFSHLARTVETCEAVRRMMREGESG